MDQPVRFRFTPPTYLAYFVVVNSFLLFSHVVGWFHPVGTFLAGFDAGRAPRRSQNGGVEEDPTGRGLRRSFTAGKNSFEKTMSIPQLF
jgi:hypothetical protein